MHVWFPPVATYSKGIHDSSGLWVTLDSALVTFVKGHLRSYFSIIILLLHHSHFSLSTTFCLCLLNLEKYFGKRKRMEFFFAVFQNSCEEIGTSDVGSHAYVEFILIICAKF